MLILSFIRVRFRKKKNDAYDVDDDGVIFLWKILRREMTSIRFDVTFKPQAAVEIDLTDEVGSHATLVGWNPAKRAVLQVYRCILMEATSQQVFTMGTGAMRRVLQAAIATSSSMLHRPTRRT